MRRQDSDVATTLDPRFRGDDAAASFEVIANPPHSRVGSSRDGLLQHPPCARIACRPSNVDSPPALAGTPVDPRFRGDDAAVSDRCEASPPALAAMPVDPRLALA